MSAKRKHPAGHSPGQAAGKKPRPPPEKKNTAIYITNLPPDITLAELEAAVARYGLVAEDVTTGQKRIKIYTDDAGVPKGDALVVFFRHESVDLAVAMLDETCLRAPGKDVANPVIRVQPADLEYKVVKDPQPLQQRTAREKREIMHSVQRLNSKLADWDDDDDQPVDKRFSRTVILKHVFTLDELEADVAAALDIKQDIRDGCEEIGPVTNVVLYDREPDGVLSVRFEREQDARECVARMHGRFFAGRRLEAAIHDGRRYKKAKKADDDEHRLDQFGDWLEGDGDDRQEEAKGDRGDDGDGDGDM